ncbi:hypothetical protein IIA79_03840 [bacterium]|nr:hypothetical protein [bacterium]
MPFFLGLMQAAAGDNMVLYGILGLGTLTALIALGFGFLRNLFEIITAPTASLRHHGHSDNVFFSVVMVFLGGLIATFILVVSQEQLSQSFNDYASTVSSDIAMMNSNPTYRDIAEKNCLDRMNGNFNVYLMNNLVFFPVVMVILWLVIGFLAFLGARMFGGQCTVGDFLSSTAYGAFFSSIGLGMAFLLFLQLLASSASQDFGQLGQPNILGIIGAILLVYGVILFLIGAVQAAELTGGQLVGVIFILLVVLGGLSYWGYYSSNQAFEDFSSEIQTFNPATGST